MVSLLGREQATGANGRGQVAWAREDPSLCVLRISSPSGCRRRRNASTTRSRADPELADRVQKVGEHLRFNSSLPARLNEFAILINARFWGSKYEWYAHRPFAIKGGLAESIADDLAQSRRPAGMKPDEALIYDFCTALHRRHAVDDADVLHHLPVRTPADSRPELGPGPVHLHDLLAPERP